MSLTWEIYSWKSLPKQKLYDLLSLRAEVFVVEQECPYQDPDGKDDQATHLLAYLDDQLVGYARIFLNKTPCEIGRVVVPLAHRGKQIGRAIMEKSISLIMPNEKIHISAQERLKSFYESLGFFQSGVGYLEDGIPHIPMLLSLKNATDL